jgi:hypothetical protein
MRATYGQLNPDDGVDMREFRGDDGRTWRARLEETRTAAGSAWEIVLFEVDSGQEIQRIVYRPAGWLHSAPVRDLITALGEAEMVRTRWP